jgi:hypothetical protein
MSAVDLAIGVAEINVVDIAHRMTNSLIQVIAKELRRQGLHGGLGDDRVLRKIVYQMVVSRVTETLAADLASGKSRMRLTDEIEKRLNTQPEKPDVLSMPPDPKKWEKLERAKKDHAAWLRRNRQQ